MYVNHFSLAQTLLLAGALAGMALVATPSRAQNDPPMGSARLAHLGGNVSIQPYGVDDWGQAYSNMPASAGDRIFTDQSGMGELQAAQIRAYFGANSDLTLVNLDYISVNLGVGQGSFNIFSDGFEPGHGFSVQTPNGAITVATRAGFRVDVYPDQQTTIITNYPNESVLTLNGGGGFYMTLPPGQSIQLTGTNPVYAQPLQPAEPDGFEHWSSALETHRFNSISARYVSPEMPGYDELDAAGDWQPESDYGPIWFPRVEAGWAPYHYGHWVHIPFFGWSWVADEPWGAAPFHYGRWVVVGGRWGWIPGPREGHPVWSPAQVVFAGGVSFGGGGVSVWFPLGPGEPYKPWYPCSPQYVDRINITNIHESRVVHVQTTYVNVVNVTNVTNITYVNRTVGVTAMRQEDFAAGKSTRAVAAVKIEPQQLAHIQPAAPAAQPPARPVILHPIAKPAAAPQQRPVLINNKGQQAVAAPNAKPVAVPVKAVPPAPKPIPGHAAIGTPTVGGKPVAPAAPVAAKPAPPAAKSPAPAAAPERGTAPPVKPAPTPAIKPEPAAPTAKAPAPPTVRPPAPAAAAPLKETPSAKAPAPAAPEKATAPLAKPTPAPTTKPAPAAKPVPAAPETKPAPTTGAKPAPTANNAKKKPEPAKKDEKKEEEKKPE